MLAIDMDTVLRLPRPFVNPLAQLIDGAVFGAWVSVPFCQLSPYALGSAGIHKWANRAVHRILGIWADLGQFAPMLVLRHLATNCLGI